MRFRLLAAGALAAALPTAPAHAANAVPTWDRHYLQDTAEGVHFEIDLGKVVLRRSHNKAARAFARRMATDHGRELLALRRLAKQLGVKPPDTPSVAEQHEVGNTTTMYREHLALARSVAKQLGAT